MEGNRKIELFSTLPFLFPCFKPTNMMTRRPISCFSLLPNPTISFTELTSFNHSTSPIASKKSLSSKPHFSSLSTPSSYQQLLETCIVNKNLRLGKLIHSKIITKGLEEDTLFATKLINLYSTCGDVPIAESVFGRVSNQNNFLVNAMIRGYSRNGLCHEALDLFYRKMEQGLKPDSYTFSCVLKVCALLSDVREGKEVQNMAIECGLGSNLFISNSLIAMFGKCGSIVDGIEVFERMTQRDIVSWNSIIRAFVDNGFYWDAMVKAGELVRSGLKPDQVTIVSVLSACTSVAAVKEVHGYAIRIGLECTPLVSNYLISVYGKCGRAEEAASVFGRIVRPDRVAWNALISSYAQNGYFQESVQLLQEMRCNGFEPDVVTYSGIISSLAQSEWTNDALRIFSEMLDFGLKPDVITLASIVPAVSGLLCLKEIHAYCFRNRLEPDRRIKNALISVYAKCDSLQYAERVFKSTMDRDVISWSSMLVGYVQNGYFTEADGTLRKMISDQIELNPITVTSILSAYAEMSCIQQGKELHQWAFKNGFDCQTFVGSALIDVYAKCGSIDYSRRVFDLITEKNLVTWNSMIIGYAVHGLGKKALEIFQSLKKPDHVSFIAILSACNHGGMVDEGIWIYNSMESFGVSRKEAHFACVVDMLGRSGRLDEALEILNTMPVKANNTDIWGALLGACKIHSNLEIGIYSANRIMDSGCENPGQYVMLSNMFAQSKRWEDVEAMRKKMSERGMKKGAGCSWIEVNKVVHSFITKERAENPEWESLFMTLKSLGVQMKEI